MDSHGHHQPHQHKKTANQYKALYKISKEKRTKVLQMEN